jgi:transcription antitermination factor NusG
MSAETQASNLCEENLWFAMSATFGRELKAKEFLEEKQVECFVPMRYEIQKDKKRKTVRQYVSAISNLIFVYTTRKNIQELKSKIPYLHYLTTQVQGRNVPITVPEYQMTQFITVCNTYNDKLVYLTPEEVNLDKGTRIRIVGGSLDGIEGTFVRVATGRKKRVIVMIEGIVGVMLSEVSDGFIQPLQQ